MTTQPTFLQRNKKKSLLALLLLFLRERKILVLLLLVLLLASTAFLPSSFYTAFPGGARFAAGIAWIAGKMGVDVSKWGLGPADRNSYQDLLAAFRAAKAGSGAGWGVLFGRGAGATGAVPNSLDMVKASRSDLDGGLNGKKGKDGKGDGSDSAVQGVLDPADARANKDGDAVAISDGDLGGEREGMVKSAFAGGFMNGLLGGGSGSGSGGGTGGLTGLGGFGGSGGRGVGGLGGDAALSGGAFAGKNFFKSSGGAAGTNSLDKAHIALGFTATSTPHGKVGGPAKGALSAIRSKAVDAKALTGEATKVAGGSRAFTQLADGRGMASLATGPACTPPACPGEYSAVTSGTIYDGGPNGGKTTFLGDPPDLGGGSNGNTNTPGGTLGNGIDLKIPDGGDAQKLIDDANKMQAEVDKCKALDAQYLPQENSLNAQMTALSDQFKSADCGGGGCSKSKLKHCNAIGDQLKAKCNEYMNVRCSHTHACPLTATQNCSNECDGATGQRAQGSHVEANTQGNTDGSGATSEPGAGLQ